MSSSLLQDVRILSRMARQALRMSAVASRPSTAGYVVPRCDRGYVTSPSDERHLVRSSLRFEPDLSQPLLGYVWRNAADFGDKEALVCGMTGRSYTYDQVRQLIERIAAGLKKLGVSKGDIIATVTPNTPEAALLFLATVHMRAINSPINPLLTPDEMSTIFSTIDPAVVATVAPLLPLVRQAIKGKGNVRVVVFGDVAVDGSIPFSTLMNEQEKLPMTEGHQLDVCTMIFTSGTTGIPKGVEYSHSAYLANLFTLAHPSVEFCRQTSGDFQENFLLILPFFHIFGVGMLALALSQGSRLVLLPKFEPQTFLKAFSDQKISVFPAVPPLIHLLVHHPAVTSTTVEHLTSVICGAAALSATFIHRMYEIVKHPEFVFQEFYGMTEVGASHFNPRKKPVIGSVGPPTVFAECQIINPTTGEVLDPTEEGELCVRGHTLMNGYYRRPSPFEEGGWFRTGDMTKFDDKGYMYIVDRLQDFVKVKGFKVSPSEVESIIRKHPGVLDVAVKGMKDERAGELLRAYIVPKKEVVLKEEMIHAFMKEHAAPQKQLKGGLRIVKEIPKSPAGKILRKNLHELD